MKRYYDTTNTTEALAGVHFDGDTPPSHIVELDGAHEFFQMGSTAPDDEEPLGYTFRWTGSEVVKEPLRLTPEEEHDQAVWRETVWVREEMEFANNEIEAILDGDGIGVESDWRDYRVALRAWPDSPNFPEMHLRPFYITTAD